ncbi:MAG: glycine zipper 2TM domain-containing protein [Bacteroidia bacterium]|nr:glycine zipper 2TM domain-containing protein [Methylotenera sp.]
MNKIDQPKIIDLAVTQTLVNRLKLNKPLLTALTLTIVIATNGCSSMSARDKSTAIGAGAGAVAGAVLTGGGTLGTLGGAAIGGVIGNQVGKGKK